MAKKLLWAIVLTLFIGIGVAFAQGYSKEHEPAKNPQYSDAYEYGEGYINWPDSGISVSFLTRDTSSPFYFPHWADRICFQWSTAGFDNADADSFFLLFCGEDMGGTIDVLDTLMAGAYADAADDSSTIKMAYSSIYFRPLEAMGDTANANPIDSLSLDQGSIAGKLLGYNWWAYSKYYLMYYAIGTKTDDTLKWVQYRWERGK